MNPRSSDGATPSGTIQRKGEMTGADWIVVIFVAWLVILFIPWDRLR